MVRNQTSVANLRLSTMVIAKLHNFLALLFLLIGTNDVSWAQTLPASPLPESPRATLTDRLRLIVLQGQGATHEAARGLAALTVVEVRDENDKPVEGAIVTFRIPQDAHAGSFAEGKLSSTGRTNSQGQVGMNGFIPSQQPGAFDVTVTAIFGNLTGQAKISQRTVESLLPTVKTKTFWQKWKWPIIIGAGVAIGGGVWAGTRSGGGGGGTPSLPPTIIVSPGPPVIGGPQ